MAGNKRRYRNRGQVLTLLWIIVLAAVGYALYLFFGRSSDHQEPKQHQTESLSEGIEIPARNNLVDEQIIVHKAFTVSYNPSTRLPNWVAWSLTSDELAERVERTNNFRPDPAVEGVAVVGSDYTRSGYDRGHMAPAADMRFDAQAMEECFYMTNICPQRRELNGGSWKELEEQSRLWAERYGVVHIVCGPVVGQAPKRIGDNRVAVPSSFFKVFLIEDNGKMYMPAFVMPNTKAKHPFDDYSVTVDSVEVLTGFDFFPLLPDSTENRLEAALFDTNCFESAQGR